MKKALCLAAFLVVGLAVQRPLWGYESSPGPYQIIPEAIWAEATGGGTWVTELYVTSYSPAATDIYAMFSYGLGYRGPFALVTGLNQNLSERFSNILLQLQALDPDFTYYGRVGGLTLFTQGNLIHAQAMTVNGNYGKTFPGLNLIEGNTAAEGRSMTIQDLVQTSTYRTFVGAYNTGPFSYVLRFRIVDADNIQAGLTFDKALGSYHFVSFNPFAEAKVPPKVYAGCRLLVDVLSGGSSVYGVALFGSIANNTTNDTYALIARMSQ
jgi:hypothetical protein